MGAVVGFRCGHRANGPLTNAQCLCRNVIGMNFNLQLVLLTNNTLAFAILARLTEPFCPRCRRGDRKYPHSTWTLCVMRLLYDRLVIKTILVWCCSTQPFPYPGAFTWSIDNLNQTSSSAVSKSPPFHWTEKTSPIGRATLHNLIFGEKPKQ